MTTSPIQRDLLAGTPSCFPSSPLGPPAADMACCLCAALGILGARVGSSPPFSGQGKTSPVPEKRLVRSDLWRQPPGTGAASGVHCSPPLPRRTALRERMKLETTPPSLSAARLT
eukprot:scaffold1474_cov256-Pinguiococcus_pyrenoidosus.AAC.6